MKKLIITIASFLIFISQWSNKYVFQKGWLLKQKTENELYLNHPQYLQSEWRIMHASHCSHASHYSHYSMMIQIETDSTRDVPRKYEEYIIDNLAKQHSCKCNNVLIKSLFITKYTHIIQKKYQEQDIDNVLLRDSTSNYIYLKYSIVGVENERSSYKSKEHTGSPYEYEYIIPCTLDKTKYFFVRTPQTICEKRDYYLWMLDLIKNLEK